MINPIAPYIILIHQQELRDEARRDHFARSFELANPSVPAWRRALGAGAQRLSDGLASAARTFDPDIDCVDAAAA